MDMGDRSNTRAADPFSGEVVSAGWLMVLLRAALIVGAGLWVYSPVFHGDWLWDDDWYITHNPLLRDGSGLWKFWFQPGAWVEYYPIEETLLWIEWHLFGDDTLGYHLATIALHLANALLVWRLLAKMGLAKGWIGGLIFAVHPACVDSVAWIAETKNTLMLLPFLLAMAAWIDYDAKRRTPDYARALGFFVVAMLCKISVAPFPFVLLLYAWWKRGRLDWRDVKVTAPFLVIAVAVALLSVVSGVWYQEHAGASRADAELGGFFMRLALAGQTLGAYFTHCFWPVHLLPIYPLWTVDPTAPLEFLPWLILGVALFWLWRRRATWGRHALLGLGFFGLMLAPFLGFFSVSFMTSTWIMDHFLYIPLIGLIGLAIAALGAVEQKLAAARPALTGIVTIVVVLLAFEANAYAVAYSDEVTLWSYTLESYPNSWLAHDNIADTLLAEHKIPEAIAEYQRTLELYPDFASARNDLGIALAQVGRYAEARDQFAAAVRLDPNSTSARNNLARAEALLAPKR
jgi:tetratricopeptide (TPR) repeat protein